jgi:hypothetical protein
MKIKSTVVSAMFFVVFLRFCISVHAQGPGGGGPVAVKCAQMIYKSCKSLYGSFPSPNGFCNDVPCFSADFCTNGEVAVIYSARQYTPETWDNPDIQLTYIPPEGGAGRLYEVGSSGGQICLYESVCDYGCEFRIGIGHRCIRKTLVPLGPGHLTDHGPCVIYPEAE